MSASIWTTSAHRPATRFEAWRHALNQSHLEWELEPATEPTFGARIRQRALEGVRVVDCHCDPCAGWRRRPQVGRGDEAYFGILFELRGREVIRQGDSEVVLGDFAMWDSDWEMEFRVLEPLHKLTLLIPKPRMKAFLGDAERYAGQVVPGSAGAGAIAAEALRRLAREFATLDEHGAGAVLDPMLSLLAATLMSRRPLAGVSAGHQESFRRFCRHIEQNLGDNELTPASVAAAHGVSLRYLHAVFAEQDVSVGRWMRQQRLARCHRELSQAGRRGTITTIAFRWGFNEMAHFSRAFKAHYGKSPREVSGTAG